MSGFMILLRLRGLRCSHPSSVVCQIFSEQLSNTSEVTNETSMLIRVSVLNQQYWMVLMCFINITHVFQADNIEATYFELNKMKHFYLTELRVFFISSLRWTKFFFILVCLEVFGERRNPPQNHIPGSHQHLSLLWLR